MNEILDPEMTKEEKQYINEMKPWQLAICYIISSVLFIFWLPFLVINKLVNLIVDVIIKLFKI